MTAPRLGVWWFVALGLGAGLLLVLAGHLRIGGYVAAAALVVGAGLRLVLPQASAGGLAVRRRLVDVVILLGLGSALFVTVRAVELAPAADRCRRRPAATAPPCREPPTGARSTGRAVRATDGTRTPTGS